MNVRYSVHHRLAALVAADEQCTCTFHYRAFDLRRAPGFASAIFLSALAASPGCAASAALRRGGGRAACALVPVARSAAWKRREGVLMWRRRQCGAGDLLSFRSSSCGGGCGLSGASGLGTVHHPPEELSERRLGVYHYSYIYINLYVLYGDRRFGTRPAGREARKDRRFASVCSVGLSGNFLQGSAAE